MALDLALRVGGILGSHLLLYRRVRSGKATRKRAIEEGDMRHEGRECHGGRSPLPVRRDNGGHSLKPCPLKRINSGQGHGSGAEGRFSRFQ